MAIGFAAFSCHNAISRKQTKAHFCPKKKEKKKKDQNHKILAHCVKNLIFNAILLHVSTA